MTPFDPNAEARIRRIAHEEAQKSMSIERTSELYGAYLKGWDAALRRAAFIFDGRDRDAILSLVKEAKFTDLEEDLRREAFFEKHGSD